MGFSLPDLVGLLELAPAGVGRFTGLSPAIGRSRVFGGLVVAQALVAMARTVAERPIHSLHAYFVLPGDPEEPIGYEVEDLRDGGSFTTRRCVARQHGRAIFTATASFHRPEPEAFDHAAPGPEAARPEDLPTPSDILSGRFGPLPPAVRAFFGRETTIELRPVDSSRFAPVGPGPSAARQAVWMRAAGALPDDPVLHAAVLAYMSDLTLLDTALVAHGRTVFDADIQAASLDHAIWFHRPARADGWLLHAEDSPSASGGLGFSRGAVYDVSGRLVASTAQEGLIRRRT